MASDLWRGERVRLRAVEPEDAEAFLRWNQDTEVARLNDHVPFPQSAERARRRASERASAEPPGDAFRWVIETLHGEAAGVINTHSIEPRSGAFSYGVSVAREHWRNGYASDAIKIVLRYYFGELPYRKAYAHVYDFNDASAALHRSLGFTEEGRLRKDLYAGGAYHDVLIFGIFAEEFCQAHPAFAPDFWQRPPGAAR